MKPSIQAIIVLYKVTARESISAMTLARSLKTPDGLIIRLRVIIFDNSPEAQVAPGLFEDEVYVSAPENRGLASAYNAGVAAALEGGFDWLLTLDQDTTLPEDFLSSLAEAIADVEGDPQVGAIVPQIQGGGRMLSPYTFRWGALPEWYPVGHSGVEQKPVYALNSASLFRVSALRQVGGYDPRFWLDGSDHAIFHALAGTGKRVFVAGNIQVNHQLSVLDMKRSMPPARYENFLAAESAFWDLCMNALAGWERTLRLAARLLRQVRRSESELRRVSWKYLKRRVLRSRRYRLREWERSLGLRVLDSPGIRSSSPVISVCMASYNGERFIEEQVRSILLQLGECNELIVVDDASSDRTRERLMAIGDPRIRLIRQMKNRGVVETFEHAVRSATGDIIFLCDGDDVWAPDKVERVMDAFARNPRVQVVTTGLCLIDERGDPIDGGNYFKNREFTAAVLPNLVRNRFQGSAMAFRSSLLPRILPFPKPRLFLHDAWIGMRNSLTGGETAYLEQPLLRYRRHGNNFSRRMGLTRQAMTRIQLVVALALRGLGWS